MAGRCDVRYFREKSGDERQAAKYEPLVLTLYHGWAMKNGQKTTRKHRRRGSQETGTDDLMSKRMKDGKRPGLRPGVTARGRGRTAEAPVKAGGRREACQGR